MKDAVERTLKVNRKVAHPVSLEQLMKEVPDPQH